MPLTDTPGLRSILVWLKIWLRSKVGMVFDDWYGFFAPAGTPPDRVDYLAGALIRAIRSPEVTAKIREAGSEAVGNTPAQFAEVLRADMARWAQAVKLSGLKLD